MRWVRVAAVGVALSIAAIVAFGAMRATGTSGIAQWGLWVAAASLVVSAIGVILPLLGDRAGSAGRPEASAQDAGEELAAVVLGQVQEARFKLLGEAGEVADVRFVKGSGRFREAGGTGKGDLKDVLGYYQSLSPRRLVILGEPGAGKTMLAMELLMGLLEQRRQDKTIPVPVLISAAAYDTNKPWEEWLTGHLVQRFSMGAQTAARLVRDRQILPMVDGLDEMDVVDEPRRARSLVGALNSFMHGRERAAVVVTCRRQEYQALNPSVDRATHIEMVPLNGSESADYLTGQLRGTEERQLWEPVLACLRAEPGGQLAAQLATPWRTTLALTVFRDSGNPAELLPGSKPDRYEQRLNTLLLDRYVPSAVRLHDPTGKQYTPQQVQRWLTALAKDLDWQARNGGSATDLQLDKWWRPAAGRTAAFAHMALVALIAVPIFLAAAHWRDGGLLMAGIGVLIITVAGGFSPSLHRLNIGQLTSRRGLRKLASSLRFGLMAGLVAGLVSGLVVGLWIGIGLVVGLVVGLVAGLASTLGVDLTSGMEDASPQAIGPREAIRADGQFGLVTGLVTGLVSGLTLGLVVGLTVGLVAGLAAGLVAGLVVGLAGGLTYGAGAWVRYHIAVVIVAIRRSGPLRFGPALDWIYQAGLLRLSGVSYQFRHRQLQDWLVSGTGDRSGDQI